MKKVNIESLTPGVYFVKVDTGAKVEIKKISKR